MVVVFTGFEDDQVGRARRSPHEFERAIRRLAAVAAGEAQIDHGVTTGRIDMVQQRGELRRVVEAARRALAFGMAVAGADDEKIDVAVDLVHKLPHRRVDRQRIHAQPDFDQQHRDKQTQRDREHTPPSFSSQKRPHRNALLENRF